MAEIGAIEFPDDGGGNGAVIGQNRLRVEDHCPAVVNAFVGYRDLSFLEMHVGQLGGCDGTILQEILSYMSLFPYEKLPAMIGYIRADEAGAVYFDVSHDLPVVLPQAQFLEDPVNAMPFVKKTICGGGKDLGVIDR